MATGRVDLSLRTLVWLGFFASILVAWGLLFAMARGAGVDWLGRPVASAMDMGAMGDMSMTGFAVLFPMWAVMMAAMMLPTMVPTLAAYEALMRSADGSRAGWLGLLLGYMTAWVGFAAAIAVLQVLLVRAGLLGEMGGARSAWLSVALLAAVGLFQFSRIKQARHGVCHAPLGFFLGYWRPGAAGGTRMGLSLGGYCVGCCWGFMALGFVGGVMSLLWMGLATAFMVLEKLPQLGHHLIRPAGAALMTAAAALAVWTALQNS